MFIWTLHPTIITYRKNSYFIMLKKKVCKRDMSENRTNQLEISHNANVPKNMTQRIRRRNTAESKVSHGSMPHSTFYSAALRDTIIKILKKLKIYDLCDNQFV